MQHSQTAGGLWLCVRVNTQGFVRFPTGALGAGSTVATLSAWLRPVAQRRFYFHLINDMEVRDAEGREFPSILAAPKRVSEAKKVMGHPDRDLATPYIPMSECPYSCCYSRQLTVFGALRLLFPSLAS
jgi:hypothetical protein